jgi:dTDP-4-amino-4,6-dideoxygalactose transaminase
MPFSLETALCRLHQRRHCVLVSSGTVGLALTLKMLGLEGLGVAIPAGVCLNVPLAVQYAGATPIYCDIEPDTLGLSPTTLLDQQYPIAAVLAVHAYGSVCAIEAIEEHCRLEGVPLIEDVAVAQGAQIDGRVVGSFGVASIVSFGRGKIVDVGGGGAVLTDNLMLAKEIRQAYAGLSEQTSLDDQRLDAFDVLHTQLYNRHYGKDLRKHIAPFVEMAQALRDATLSRRQWSADDALIGLERLNDNLIRRRALSIQLLERTETKLPRVCGHRPSSGSVPWRANIFIPACRDAVLRGLLADGLKISSWYPPAQDFLAPSTNFDTPVARRVGEEILNVWINDEVDTGYLDKVVERIVTLMKAAE